MVDIALLGTGGMMPLHYRFLTSMMCRINGRLLLIDCGEGTQVTMRIMGWGFKAVDVICITHYHADHISGLPGLLLTIGNSGRTELLHIVGPQGIMHVVKCLCVIAPDLPFDIIFHELDENRLEDIKIGEFKINALPLKHRITCFAYSLELERQGKFDLNKAQALNIPQYLWSKLQKNEIVEFEGAIYDSSMVMGEKRKGIKVSYCTDTRPIASLSEFVKNSDLFICEGLYGQEEYKEKAISHRHMIFSEAAAIAKEGDVKELWLTHFSPALTDPEEHINNARNIFRNTLVGRDRMSISIKFE